jgi:hypothetical protein
MTGACIGNLWAFAEFTTFDELCFNNSFNDPIGASHQSGGFTFTSSERLLVYGRNHASHPGSGAVDPTSSAFVTITRADGGAFGFCGGHFAERSSSSANPNGVGGTRADGGTTTRHDALASERGVSSARIRCT